jgi:hypothetical protein
MTNDTPLRSAAQRLLDWYDFRIGVQQSTRAEVLAMWDALRTALEAPKEPSEPDVEAECALIEKAARVAFEPLRKQYAMSVIGRYSGELAYPEAFAKAMSEIWRKGRPAALGAPKEPSEPQWCPECRDELEAEWFCFGCDKHFAADLTPSAALGAESREPSLASSIGEPSEEAIQAAGTAMLQQMREGDGWRNEVIAALRAAYAIDGLRASSPAPSPVQADRSHSGKVPSQFGNRSTPPTGEPE